MNCLIACAVAIVCAWIYPPGSLIIAALLIFYAFLDLSNRK